MASAITILVVIPKVMMRDVQAMPAGVEFGDDGFHRPVAIPIEDVAPVAVAGHSFGEFTALADNPHLRVLFVSAERFTNEFIWALQNHRINEFREQGKTILFVTHDLAVVEQPGQGGEGPQHPEPDHHLEVGSGSQAVQTARRAWAGPADVRDHVVVATDRVGIRDRAHAVVSEHVEQRPPELAG